MQNQFRKQNIWLKHLWFCDQSSLEVKFCRWKFSFSRRKESDENIAIFSSRENSVVASIISPLNRKLNLRTTKYVQASSVWALAWEYTSEAKLENLSLGYINADFPNVNHKSNGQDQFLFHNKVSFIFSCYQFFFSFCDQHQIKW